MSMVDSTKTSNVGIGGKLGRKRAGKRGFLKDGDKRRVEKRQNGILKGHCHWKKPTSRQTEENVEHVAQGERVEEKKRILASALCQKLH